MSVKRVLIVGAGKRVRQTALPAFLSLPESYEVAGVLARSARDLDAAGRRFAVRPLAELAREEAARADLVYVAVGKDAVPAVLAQLHRLDGGRLELLIDTPVLRFKHLRHAALLDGWLRASVAEDTAFLPWYEAVRACAGQRGLGAARSVLFDRSAYAYHGLAQAKALLGGGVVRRARRTRVASGGARREVELASGARATMLEPRDYSLGRVVVGFERGRVADRLESGEDGLEVAPVVAGGLCVGFRAGEISTHLAPAEAELTRGDPPGASVTARMESMKRIGFRRLLERVARGEGGYPLSDGLDDMAVDWFLERFGRWSAVPWTDIRSPLGRTLWSTIGRIA